MCQVLVVDDQVENCAPLVRLFKRAGLECRCATGGVEALAALADRRPAVVLLDVMMPLMGGLEVLRRVRADPACDGVAVLMYSADWEPATRAAAMGLGAQGYVQKGTPFADVLAAVRRHLGPA